MQHHRAKRKLGRVKRQRVALLRSLARSLVQKQGITTTVAKAKELRPYVERLVSKSRLDTIAARRSVHAELGATTAKLYEIRDRFEKRAGGYTRIVRLGRVGKRVGEMARIEFVQ